MTTRKRGRPAKPDAERVTTPLSFCVTEAESKQIYSAARTQRITVSHLLRLLVRKSLKTHEKSFS